MLRTNVVTLLSFVVVFGIVFLIGRKNAHEFHYDEMQLKIRGDAYKFGFYTIIALLAVTGLLYVAEGLDLSRYMTTDMLLFVILYAGVVVFAVYSILKDSFFRVLENGNRYLLLCACIIMSNAVSLIQRIQTGRFLENGVLDFSNGGANVLCLIGFLMIFGAIVIRKVGRDEEEDEKS